MFKFMRSARAKQDSQFPDTAMAMPSGSTLQANDVQRELILIAYRDTMRMHGVPAQWLDCKVINTANGDGTERTQIQLIMNKWSGHVLRYAMALERQLVQCLDRYGSNEPFWAEWVWKFGAECDCPFPTCLREEWARKSHKRRAPYRPFRGHLGARCCSAPLHAVHRGVNPPAVSDKDFDLRHLLGPQTRRLEQALVCYKTITACAYSTLATGQFDAQLRQSGLTSARSEE